jgi:prolyl-tRNA synthetase
VNVDDIDKYQEGGKCGGCGEMGLVSDKAAEVGNIFDLGQKYAKAFEINFTDKDGNRQLPVMGCYGIGVSRTMGVIVEKFNDAKGIVWPESVAPFKYHLINHNDSIKETEELYKKMVSKGLEVVWDDREVGMGQKFSDADLIGVPYRIVVSPKSLAAGGYEMKKRNVESTTIVTNAQLLGN